jgi:hypothetical protein
VQVRSNVWRRRRAHGENGRVVRRRLRRRGLAGRARDVDSRLSLIRARPESTVCCDVPAVLGVVVTPEPLVLALRGRHLWINIFIAKARFRRPRWPRTSLSVSLFWRRLWPSVWWWTPSSRRVLRARRHERRENERRLPRDLGALAERVAPVRDEVLRRARQLQDHLVEAVVAAHELRVQPEPATPHPETVSNDATSANSTCAPGGGNNSTTLPRFQFGGRPARARSTEDLYDILRPAARNNK